jgi:tetratricopeptide (TPR) repeat protein
MPINFAGKIGIFKVANLPRDAQLYLEGYFEKDPYRAKPIKFAEIVFGKPIYVPFGRYILELRKNRQLGQSQTFLDEVVYRREFNLNATQTTYTVDVKDDDLKAFPVQLTSVPPGAKVFIDEKEVGITPFNGSFPVGEHLLSLKRDGYFDFVQVIKMEINMPYTAEVPLKTSAAGELINKADALMKEARYAEALPVLVDALSKSPSELETAQISYMVGLCYLKQKSYKEAQDYFLKAMQNDAYKFPGRLGIATVIFEQGDRMKALQLLVEVLVSAEDAKVRTDGGALFQRLSPLKSVLYITSEPSGARVFVNSSEVEQKTPLILHDLGVGSYKILFRKEGYQDEEIKLNLGVSEFRPVVAKLKRQ